MDRKNERRLEHLLGRKVYSLDGRVVGRLEEFRAEREGEHYVIADYRIGTAALLERLSVGSLGVLRAGHPKGYHARWDQLNIEDPDRPTLTVPVAELRAIRR